MSEFVLHMKIIVDGAKSSTVATDFLHLRKVCNLSIDFLKVDRQLSKVCNLSIEFLSYPQLAVCNPSIETAQSFHRQYANLPWKPHSLSIDSMQSVHRKTSNLLILKENSDWEFRKCLLE